MIDGNKIREKRESLGLSRAKLSSLLAISENSLAKWEGGHQPSKEEDRVKLRKFLGEEDVKVNGNDEDFKTKYYTLLEKYTALLEKK